MQHITVAIASQVFVIPVMSLAIDVLQLLQSHVDGSLLQFLGMDHGGNEAKVCGRLAIVTDMDDTVRIAERCFLWHQYKSQYDTSQCEHH